LGKNGYLIITLPPRPKLGKNLNEQMLKIVATPSDSCHIKSNGNIVAYILSNISPISSEARPYFYHSNLGKN